MNIIVDSNILFSALIKDSLTRRLILEYDGYFLCPSKTIQEFEKYYDIIIEKSELDIPKFNVVMESLFSKLTLVQDHVLFPYIPKSLALLKDIDIDDFLFIACALAYPDSILWSNDKALKKQNVVQILNTQEIIEKLK
jgi:predicted nucleic acid-binding protein